MLPHNHNSCWRGQTSKFAVNVWLLFTPQSAINQRSVTDQTGALSGANVQSRSLASMENLSEKVINKHKECCRVYSHGSACLQAQEGKNKPPYVAVSLLPFYSLFQSRNFFWWGLDGWDSLDAPRFGFHALTLSGVGGHPIGTGSSQPFPRGIWRTSWRSGALWPFIYPCWACMLAPRQYILLLPSTVFWWMVH